MLPILRLVEVAGMMPNGMSYPTVACTTSNGVKKDGRISSISTLILPEFCMHSGGHGSREGL